MFGRSLRVRANGLLSTAIVLAAIACLPLPASAALLKSVTSGTVTLPNNTTPTQIALAGVDITKAFVICSHRSFDSTSSNMLYACDLNNGGGPFAARIAADPRFREEVLALPAADYERMIVDYDGRVLAQVDPGPGEKVVVGPIDIDALRAERDRRRGHDMLGHLRSGAHDYLNRDYLLPAGAQAGQITKQLNEQRIAAARNWRREPSRSKNLPHRET